MKSFGIVDRLVRAWAELGSNRSGSDTPAPGPEPPDPQREAYTAMLATALGDRSSEYVALADAPAAQVPTPVRLIAFYLPQFHPIPENDRWWGRGFTEWTNVSRAVPQFAGHYQPHLPGELGFYDLRVPDVQRRQVELARMYGVSGFCFHYYWFAGKRLLERPLEQFMADPAIDFPFCICWANENWTRRWDGREDDVLMAQHHGDDTDATFIADVEPVLRHRNYLRFEGRPVLLVYHTPLLPNPVATAMRWREHCVRAGLGNPYLIAAQVFEKVDPTAIGFDAAVEFPPNTAGRSLPPSITPSLSLVNPGYTGTVYRYADLMAAAIEPSTPAYQRFKTVCPGWDNEPRRAGRGSTYAFSSPALYGQWLEAACRSTLTEPDPEKRVVFINAWNEWGEGAYLEPDRRYGYAYLQATQDVMHALAGAVSTPPQPHGPALPPDVHDVPAGATSPRWQWQIGEAMAAFEAKFGRDPAVLDWNSGLEIAAAFPSATVFSPPDTNAPTLPHLDRSIDVVVCAEDAARVDEARRVASGMVVAVGAVGTRREWIADAARDADAAGDTPR